MTIVAVIQARLGSTRLPGKVLLDLGGRPALAWLVRAARAIPGIDRVLVATSDRPNDDRLAAWCDGANVECWRGPEADVLERFRQAAVRFDADLIMRLTADCPLLDPTVAGMLIALQRATGADYVSNVDPRSWPDGLDCELVTRAALDIAAAEATTAYDREHVTPYIRANPRRFPAERLACPIPGLSQEHWTLDRPEDFEFLQAVIGRLPNVDRPPALAEVLQVLADEPRLRTINRMPAVAAGGHPAPAGAITTHSTEASQKLLARALNVIPLGAQTLSKSHVQFPAGAPYFLTHGSGARVWDVDGNQYVDLISALLPILLGYRDPDVDQAVRRQLGNGVSFSLPTELEVELAEQLVALIPAAEQVRFGKNGTDVTSAATRLARAVTGRDRIAVGGYHGWQDWSIGGTPNDRGVPGAVRALTHRFAFNDIAALRQTLEAHPGEFAAVILEPVGFAEPKPGYLEDVRRLTHRHGALLVFDEIVTGFRIAAGGAQAYYGVTPDLACFGKAMANGLPLSALVGRGDLMRELETVFFSGTFGGETLSLAAALAVLAKLRREPVLERLWQRGSELFAGATAEIAAAGLSDTIALGGLAPWKILAFSDHPGGSRQAVKTVLLREMLARGVLIAASHNVTAALTDADVGLVLGAWRGALAVVGQELDRGDLDARLGNSLIRPPFQARAAS
ncbi:MAG TPA: aminotransferase class III-fold pyridoxal phosphate-dependent enzyme [Candidatus Sulfotelmatobacter sp.]|nr:aminotransferase class III-fold pyridoxal phosphate-dependent enzyme [Candidatus Sulfotelmatobacter sp.]